MIHKLNITDHPYQIMKIKVFGYHLRFTLKYNTMGNIWNYDLYDITNNKDIIKSCGLAVNSPTLIEQNLPFVICMLDTSGMGINPIQREDMGSRLIITLMKKEEYYAAIWQTSRTVLGK